MCDVKPCPPVPKEPCSPEDKKKCKVTKVKPPDLTAECVEPMPPPVVEKVLFKEDSNDPLVQERLKCLEDCHVQKFYNILKACDARVTRKLLYTAETCHDETADLMQAVDECVKDKAFKRLA